MSVGHLSGARLQGGACSGHIGRGASPTDLTAWGRVRGHTTQSLSACHVPGPAPSTRGHSGNSQGPRSTGFCSTLCSVTPGTTEGTPECCGHIEGLSGPTQPRAVREGFPEVPASPRDEALFHCSNPSGVPRGPANSTASLTSQRHPEKFPQIPGRSRGK